MEALLIRFFLLLFGHALADYPLQTDFIAKGKNRHTPTVVPWYYLMTAHSLIHAGFVFLFTGSLLLAVLEFVSHFVIDVLKCEGYTNIHQDQLMHVCCKAAWTVI